MNGQQESIPRRGFFKKVARTGWLFGGLLAGSELCGSATGSSQTISNGDSGTDAGWRKYAHNPVLGGKFGTCFDVCLLKEGDIYRMWFSWRPKQSIALVESRDGIRWNDPVIVLGPDKKTGWEDDVNRPIVIQHGATYQMWYTGQARGRSWIGFATSPDGKAWNRMSVKPVLVPQEAWEKVAVMCPDVLWDEARGQYRMWYSAGGQYEPNAIGYAASADGMHWKKLPTNPIFGPDPKHLWEQNRVTACQVISNAGWYYMFYIGFRDIDTASIGLARSRDGIRSWERHPSNPIISPGKNQWDADACYKPFAIPEPQRWLLWYNGRRDHVEQIGLAFHPGTDLGF